jgi:hypothetical protein
LGNLLGAPAAVPPTNAPATNPKAALTTNTVNTPVNPLLSTNSPAKAIEGLLRGFGKPKN